MVIVVNMEAKPQILTIERMSCPRRAGGPLAGELSVALTILHLCHKMSILALGSTKVGERRESWYPDAHEKGS